MYEEEKDKIQVPAAVKQPPTSDELMKEYNAMPAFDRNAFYDTWKSGRKPMMEALMSAYTNPEATVTPEQARKARNAAALSDAFSSLSEIVSLARGGGVRRRSGQSSVKTTNDRLAQLQNKYEQDMIRYNMARGNAESHDFREQLRAAMDEDGQKRKNILLRAEYAKKLEDEARKSAQRAAENQEERAFKMKLLEQQRADRQATMRQQFANQKELARYRHSLSGGGKSGGLVLSASEDDPNATTDALGRRVVPVNLTKQQINSYAQSAKSDADFMRANPDLKAEKKDMYGNSSTTYAKDDLIAHRYAQHIYNKKFEKNTPSQAKPKATLKRTNPNQPAGGWGNGASQQKDKYDNYSF